MGSEPTELNGSIVLTDRQLKVETEITTDGYISRSVTLTYGETTINGRFLRTGSKKRQQVSNVIWEIGSALADYTEAPEDVDYLREALTEATAGTTSISGGLVLSNMISVGSGSNGLLAGMCGTSQAGDGSFPMIWAGATAQSREGVMGAAFRVYNSGHVDMSDTTISSANDEATGSVEIGNGRVALIEGTTTKTELSAEDMNGSIDQAIKDMGGAGLTNQTFTLLGNTKTATYNGSPQLTFSNSYSSVNGKTLYTTATLIDTQVYTCSAVKLFTATRDGICTSTSAATPTLTVTGSVSSCATVVGTGNGTVSACSSKNSVGTKSVNIEIRKDSANGTVVKTFSSISASSSFNVTARTTYYARYSIVAVYSFGFEALMKNVASASSYTFIASVEASMTSTVSKISATYDVKYPNYVNRVYTDGLLISKNSTQYAGMTSADATVMQMRSANALLKFGANGLMQSLNGGTNYYRANPLVLVVRLTYSSGSLKPTALYNPLGMSVSATRSGTGVYVITHNLGHTSYTVMGSGLGSDNYCQYVTPYNITASAVTIFTSNNGGYREMSWADVFFYDYRTL